MAWLTPVVRPTGYIVLAADWNNEHVNDLIYLHDNYVSSFNGRGSAVVPASGDYTAAQVTNAADKSSGSAQIFTGDVQLNSGHLLIEGDTEISHVEPGGVQLYGSSGYGILYLGNASAGYIRPFGDGLHIADGASSSTAKVGFFGATPQPQQSGGLVGGRSVSGATAAHIDDQFTGGIGSTVYTIGDIVAALKLLGLIRT